MPETLTRHSALAEVYETGYIGPADHSPGISVQHLQGLSIIQVAAYTDIAKNVNQMIKSICGLAPADKPRQAVMQDEVRILWNGPQRWWIVQPEDSTLAGRLRGELGADAAVTEYSHGRVVLRLSGPAVRDLLAKGSAVDFHKPYFQVGWSRPLALEHFDVQLHCLNDAASVDVYISRSLAVSFWEWLIDAAGEFGVEILESTI